MILLKVFIIIRCKPKKRIKLGYIRNKEKLHIAFLDVKRKMSFLTPNKAKTEKI